MNKEKIEATIDRLWNNSVCSGGGTNPLVFTPKLLALAVFRVGLGLRIRRMEFRLACPNARELFTFLSSISKALSS